jgi:exosortase/archaeosortase family protein|tara:strand:+ start:126 stop:674 length:549 start_codon:yes stop_codon:yes gene_type:complete
VINVKNKLTLSPLSVFLLKAGAVYAVWHLLYDYILLPDGRLDTFMSFSGVRMAADALSICGWEVESSGRILNVFNARGVEILNDCNGLDLLGIYTGFIIAYPGPIRKRLLLLAGGLLLLYFANVLRIAVLALSNVYYPDYWDNVHGASSYVFFYPLILGLWYIWTIISDQKTIFSAGDFSSA